eukprot:TRINITY_DN17735_c0_g1_i2.p1 TRINITY_DN17735_c0_g1~~TRINITY_DN17735_c0_g1_i2.p1  ORF type:complete len:252 (-),score=35.02 TRINITY_DN17735_c0_g1_i2:167-922(-)
MPKKIPLTESERRAMLNTTAKHTVYFLALDQIGHHLIIETRAAHARVYQCYVEQVPDENGDCFGFSAREWLTGLPDDPEAPLAEGILAARERWGGKSPITRNRLQELLDLLFRIKDLSNEVAAAMFEHVPESVRDIEASYQERKAYSKQRGGLELPEGGLALWSKSIVDKQADCVKMIRPSAPGEPTVVSSNDRFVGTAFELSIPAGCADAFVDAYAELIGQPPQAPVFMMVLHHFNSAQGWGVRAATIPH